MRKKLSTKSDRKIEFLTCKNCVQKFSAYTFFVGCFLHFFQRFQTPHQMLCFMIPKSTFKKIYFAFYQHFLLTSKRLKKLKSMSLIPDLHLQYLWSGEAPLCKKKLKSLYPLHSQSWAYLVTTVLLLYSLSFARSVCNSLWSPFALSYEYRMNVLYLVQNNKMSVLHGCLF